MAALVRQAAAGAAGFSTTRTILHRAKDGELAAGTTASADELIGIGLALGEPATGVSRWPATCSSPRASSRGWPRCPLEAGRPVTFGCLQDDVRPEHWRRLLDLTDKANADGAHLVPQVAGRPACVLFGLESTAHPFMFHQAYQLCAALPFAERIAELRKPEVRDAILGEDTQARASPPSSPRAGTSCSCSATRPTTSRPPTAASPPSPSARGPRPAGRRLRPDAGGRRPRSAVPAAARLQPRRLPGAAGDADPPGTVLGLGDGGAHCGLLCDASLPTYMLSHWARTASGATGCRSSRRCTCRPGRPPRCTASTIAACWPRGCWPTSTSSTSTPWPSPPGDGLRPARRRPPARPAVAGLPGHGEGGEIVRRDDEATGERPGRLLRGPQPAPA